MWPVDWDDEGVTLEDTVGMMCSDDWKDRLKAEYIQLQVRRKKLHEYHEKLENKATAEGAQMRAQMNAMRYYRDALKNRMEDVGINVASIDELVGFKPQQFWHV